MCVCVCVSTGKWNDSVDIAIKTMRDGRMKVEEFFGECNVMKSLRHPNILALYAVCTKEEPLLIITEFMSQGALLDLIRKEDMNLQLQLYIATQVSHALHHVHVLTLLYIIIAVPLTLSLLCGDAVRVLL